jgi:hypothetical protein
LNPHRRLLVVKADKVSDLPGAKVPRQNLPYVQGTSSANW